MARGLREFLIFRLGSWTLFVQQALRSQARSGETFAPFFCSFALKNRHEISPATTVDAAEEWLEGLENSRIP